MAQDQMDQCSPALAQQTDLRVAYDTVVEHFAYPQGAGAELTALQAFAFGVVDDKSPESHLLALERFMFALADHHSSLNTNNAFSSRLVPLNAVVWAEARDGEAFISAVRPGSEARQSGLREGMAILAINGAPVSELALPPHGPGGRDSALGFAVRMALAGTHDADASVTVETAAGPLTVQLTPANSPAGLASLSWPAVGVPMIRLHDSLDDPALPAVFDDRMAQVRGAPVLILDLRDTPSGGNTSIARPVMSWFVEGERAYQVHARPGRGAWTEYVQGRPDRFTGRLLVLADRWTGSMGEGTTIGLRSAAGATWIGTPMAGLRGAMEAFELPCLGASLRIPTERLYSVEGTPRELATPDILVTEHDLAAAGEGDAVLARALLEAGAVP